MTTYECINSVDTQVKVNVLQRTKNKFMVCGLDNETVEFRRLNDLEVISAFSVPARCTICELTDGSFVSGSYEHHMKRWDIHGTVLQTFDHSGVKHVIELKSDIIVSGTSDSVKVWKVSTGECLQVSTHNPYRATLEKLSDDLFLFNSFKAMAREIVSRPFELYASQRWPSRLNRRCNYRPD